ncbi:MAG: acyl-CoA dehydrogenase family protein [Gammaproteobacteria bacterium]|nr:acyl-CoA dehydrogenase family protein [Gammaproteobacteria bacterium]
MKLGFSQRDRTLQAAASRAQLEHLALIAAEMPAEGESVADDEAFQRKCQALEVTLLGLEMLELRIRHEVESGRAARAEKLMLSIKCAELAQAIADLTLETLGYYALPFPDQVPGDNERPVGPEHALAALQSWLASHSSSGAEVSDHKNTIARVALDL